MKRLLPLTLSLLLAGCTLTRHPTQPATLGQVRTFDDLNKVIDVPGPVTVDTVNTADWGVARSGLINLNHPTAIAAGLQDGEEPIQVFFHALHHPERGLFVVDTGTPSELRDHPDDAAIRGMIAKAANTKGMKFGTTLGDYLKKETGPLRGVFLTHFHLDHIMGMPDVPDEVPLFAGPGETGVRTPVNALTRGTLRRTLKGNAPVEFWNYAPDPTGHFEGVVDILGDNTVWALWVPGHTPGSTAYVIRTPTGPVLLTGDACHTRWGWEHDVEPGTFSADIPKSAESFKKLKALAAEHPTMDVRFGHQR